jgi:ZIP family zinc transporter
MFYAISLFAPWIEALFNPAGVQFTATESVQNDGVSSKNVCGLVKPTGSDSYRKTYEIKRSQSERFVMKKRGSKLAGLVRSPSVPALPTYKKNCFWNGRRHPLLTHLCTRKVESDSLSERKRKEALRISILLAAVLTLHNLPEGLAVAISASESSDVGFTVMVAIALHNIPEGICVAATALEATGDKWYAIRMSFYSGLSEPLGAMIAIFLFGDKLATAGNHIMAGVAGIMCAVAFCELIPDAYRYRSPLSALCGFACGTAVMIGTIKVLDG